MVLFARNRPCPKIRTDTSALRRVCEKMLARWFFECYSLCFKGLEDKEHMDEWSDYQRATAGGF
ncbi:MAG: hypothetical protein QM570_13590, partial [Planctomycetota bacterium]|nr:hypothetical protein [Planctomycetota bacterium]